MNTKFLKIFASTALVFAASSCVELDQYPLDQTSDGTYWLKPSDAEQAVTNLYQYLPSVYEADEDANTDNVVWGIDWAVSNVGRGIFQSQDMSWKSYYAGIRKANKVLERTPDIPNIDQNTLNQVLGQAYFFRGYLYYELIKKFGDVPLVLNTLNLDDQADITRTDWKTVYDQAMSDLDNAISMLPASWGMNAPCRATKWAAQAIKARCALYFANSECKHSVSGAYNTARDAAKAIMDGGGFSIPAASVSAADYDPDDYARLFWNEGARSSEIILGQEYLEGSDQSCWFLAFETFPAVGWGGLDPTQGFVDCFEDVQGAPIAKSTIYDEKNPFANRDPRLEATVLHDGEVLYDKTIKVAPLPSSFPTGIGGQPNGNGDSTNSGYYNQKYMDPTIYGEMYGWDYTYFFPVIRYTEVLLTYAEALNELSDRPQEAFDAVNIVRARVGMPALQKTDSSLPTYCATQDELRQRIRNEWRIEFVMEGDRRQWDVRRWNIAMDVLNAQRYGLKYTLVDSPDADPKDGGKICILYQGDNYIHEEGPKLGYKAHNYVYPVPQHDIDLNKNITQNEGY